MIDGTTRKVPEGTTVPELLQMLNIPETSAVALINGAHAMENYIIRENDQIYLIKPVVGG